MKKSPFKLSGFKNITLINTGGHKFMQDIANDGHFYIPPSYEGSHFFAKKEKDDKIEVYEGWLKYD